MPVFGWGVITVPDHRALPRSLAPDDRLALPILRQSLFFPKGHQVGENTLRWQNWLWRQPLCQRSSPQIFCKHQWLDSGFLPKLTPSPGGDIIIFLAA